MAEVRRKRSYKGLLIFAVVLVVLGVAGFFTWRYLNTYESTDDAEVDGHINAISARISGNVIAVLAEDEQVVKAGDVLVKIDPAGEDRSERLRGRGSQSGSGSGRCGGDTRKFARGHSDYEREHIEPIEDREFGQGRCNGRGAWRGAAIERGTGASRIGAGTGEGSGSESETGDGRRAAIQVAGG
jgi:hypothetical protein